MSPAGAQGWQLERQGFSKPLRAVAWDPTGGGCYVGWARRSYLWKCRVGWLDLPCCASVVTSLILQHGGKMVSWFCLDSWMEQQQECKSKITAVFVCEHSPKNVLHILICLAWGRQSLKLAHNKRHVCPGSYTNRTTRRCVWNTGMFIFDS